MTQQYMYLLKESIEPAVTKGLLEKLSTKGGPGAIIVLIKEEHRLAESMISIPIGPPPEGAVCPHGISIDVPCLKCKRFQPAL